MATEITTQVTVSEVAEADGTRLDPGTYFVRMPASYDPDLVTGVDILCDGLVYIVDDPEDAPAYALEEITLHPSEEV
jgi:hypothetical protein